MKYRRLRIDGATYFFTVVTHERKPILTVDANLNLLREAFREVMKKRPFTIDAIVILPDHLHCIWTMPKDNSDFSTRWRLIKTYFSRRCDSQFRSEPSLSRTKKSEQAIWQRRYWEHYIRNQEDYNRHIDYIHYNPVKHGYVRAPKDWAASSFHKFAKEGRTDINWGASIDIQFDDSIGHE